MSQIEQNFELPDETATINKVPRTSSKPSTRILILIILPVMVFFGLLATLIILTQNQRQTTPIQTQTPTPTAIPTPASPFMESLISVRQSIQDTNPAQPQIAPPQLDLEVKFESQD